jgi:tRNA G18 (ribose-2'-O)-methylase SpoU
MKKERGYFGIGVINGKCEANIGTLWRSANIMGAQFIFTIGKRYPKKQCTDTMQTPRHIPLFEYETYEDFKKNIPRDCELICVELDEKSKPIATMNHPERAVYLLGAEDKGIPQEVLKDCRRIIQLPGDYCLNVSVAGSIILYDRFVKGTTGSSSR